MKYLIKIINLNWSQLFDGAAVMSYYFLFSLFPGALALVSVSKYLVPESAELNTRELNAFHIPPMVSEMLSKTISGLVENNNLGLFSIGFVIAIWTVSSGVMATIRQINLTCKIKETRSFIKLRLTSVLISFALGLLLLMPTLIGTLLSILKPFLTSYSVFLVEQILNIKYIVYLTFTFTLLNIIYYWGPNVTFKFKEIFFGALIAAMIFVFSNFAFEYYLSVYGNYDMIYGSLAAVVVLMLWFYMLSFLILFGAEINMMVLKRNIKKASR